MRLQTGSERLRGIDENSGSRWRTKIDYSGLDRTKASALAQEIYRLRCGIVLHMRAMAVPIAAFVLGALLVGIFYSPGKSASNEDIERSSDHVSNSLVGATEITCTYPQILYTSYNDGKVAHSLPPPETNANIFTFSDFNDSEVAKLKYVDATRTISETPIVKIREDAEKMVFVDGTGQDYLSTHMIFKADGVAIFTKGVSLLGIPAGTLAIGTCVGL